MTGLLERTEELRQLRESVAAAADRRGSVVLVTGEAGISKSSLLREWTASCADDARILVGYCDDFLTSRTLGPFHDVARTTSGPLADAVGRADTGEVLDALLDVLDNPLRPTVLIIEDMHWADEATLDVVRYVGRRIANLPAVLAVTYREDEVGPEHPLTGVIGVLPATQVRRVRPRPLSHAAVTRLTEGTDLDPVEVLRSTGGNPFFVTEVVQTGRGVPASVADAVLARLRMLPADARGAVELLAVVPRPAPRTWLESLLGDPEVLAVAEERGVLAVTDGNIGFRHELARQAVLGSLPSSTRLHHHETVLKSLLAVDGDADAILHHAVESGRTDLILTYGPAVAHQAFRAGAHRQAVVHQERVLRHAELLADDDRAALLEEHAWSLYNLHRFEAAAVTADRAVEIRARGGDPVAHVRSVLVSSRMAYMTNRPERSLALIDEADGLAAGLGDADVEAEVRVNRTAMLHLTDRHEEAIAEGTAALALVTAGQRPDLHVLAHVYRGGARYFVNAPEGLKELREGIDLGLATNQVEPTARGFTNYAEFVAASRRWDEAEAAITEAMAFYDDHDLPAHGYNTRGQHAHMLLALGRWDEADQLFRELDAMDVEAGVLAAILRGGQALLAVRRGDDDAQRLVRDAWELALAGAQDWYIVHAACAALEFAWSEQQPSLADPYVVPALDAAVGRFWAGWVHWRLDLLGRRPPTTDLPDGPERTSIEEGPLAGAAAWEAAGMPYEQAIDLLRSGDEQAIRKAVGILDDLGADPAAAIARQRLRELGVRGVPRGPQASTRENPAGLTDRQLEVLMLLAEGLTNADIADRLVVSVRTVDHHVSAILQKLGVASRQDAAKRARELRAI